MAAVIFGLEQLHGRRFQLCVDDIALGFFQRRKKILVGKQPAILTFQQNWIMRLYFVDGVRTAMLVHIGG